MVPESVEREVMVEAPVDVVWAIITQPEHVAKWLSDSVEIDPRPGGDAAFTWEQHGVSRGRVERVEPPRLFAFRWVAAIDANSEQDVVDGNSTLVEFHLSPEGETTRVRVVETGFDRLDGPDERNAEVAESHDSGWLRELGELQEYVAQVRSSV